MRTTIAAIDELDTPDYTDTIDTNLGTAIIGFKNLAEAERVAESNNLEVYTFRKHNGKWFDVGFAYGEIDIRTAMMGEDERWYDSMSEWTKADYDDFAASGELAQCNAERNGHYFPENIEAEIKGLAADEVLFYNGVNGHEIHPRKAMRQQFFDNCDWVIGVAKC